MSKFWHNVSSLAVLLIGSVIAYDWTGLGISPHVAGEITMGLGLIKTVANTFAE